MTKFNKYVSAAFLAVTLASAVGCSSTPQREGTGQYIDDSVITAKVKAALIEDKTTKATEINVEPSRVPCNSAALSVQSRRQIGRWIWRAASAASRTSPTICA